MTYKHLKRVGSIDNNSHIDTLLGLMCNEENLASSASLDNNKVNEIFRKMVHLKLLMRDIKTKSEAFVTKITNIIR